MPIWHWTLWDWFLFETMTAVFLCVVGLVVILIVMALEGGEVSYTVKDSGKREKFDGGMVRDTAEGKANYALVADGPMLRRWADHLTKGAVKYAKRNWMKAQGEEEYERFRESAFRHFMQWYYGDSDEDHAAAVFFNVNGAEYAWERIDEAISAPAPEPSPPTSSRPVGREEILIELHDLAAPRPPEELYFHERCPGCPECVYTITEPS